MANKTIEQLNEEIGQLFWQAGQCQYLCRGLKEALSREHSKLNALNQKIEAGQKQGHLMQQAAATNPSPMETKADDNQDSKDQLPEGS
jgi:hypothetical protein